ncbi:MAG: radical SAM protein [Sciscionella sp.]
MLNLRFAWLEITGKCQLACDHCYADSGPKGTDGVMQSSDWIRVIDDIVQLGGWMVQFIGGEQTLHRSLPVLVHHALGRGLEVEVFSNFTHVSPQLWELFAQPGVRLATSYYSDDAAQHAAITKGRGSHARTRANVSEALRRRIPLRVGLINVHDGQRVEQARAELEALGVSEIGVDRVRQVGRGVRNQAPSLDQLCGNCGNGRLAVAPDGTVWPCVFSRWLPVGNARQSPLAEIMGGRAMVESTAQLATRFGSRVSSLPCVPDMCDPQCGPSCSPACRPASNCRPVGACVPTEY